MPRKRRPLTDLLDDSAAEQWRSIPDWPAGKSGPCLKVSREPRLGYLVGIPATDATYRVTSFAAPSGGVCLKWTSGTKKRASEWTVTLSIKEIRALEALATSKALAQLEHELGVARLESHCWRELVRAAAPGEFEAREEEVNTFLREGPPRRPTGKARSRKRRASKG